MKRTRKIDIGNVVKRSGLSPSTLRFYEEKGLIKSVGRNGLRRIFEESVLERLSLITLGSFAGFSLDEISQMFPSKGRPQINRQKLLEKADELDQKIKRLTAIRKGLIHAAHCPEKNQLDCPNFLRILKRAKRRST